MVTVRFFAALAWCCGVLLSPALYAEAPGQPCEELDGQDGVVTDATYSYFGWRCHDLTLANDAGADLSVRLRWNRSAAVNRATLVWLAGGDGSKPHAEIDGGIRGDVDPRVLRDRLDQDDRIRSIEVQFRNTPTDNTGLGGYWAPPRRGYLRAAQAFAQVLRAIRTPPVDLVRGDWLTLVGSSNGATVIAFGLAYLGFDRLAERFVFVSGPFLGDTLRECRDPGFFAYTGLNDGVTGRVSGAEIRRLISAVNGWRDCAEPGVVDVRRSALGPGAQQIFPGTEIEVVMGAEDELGPWILRSNAYWAAHIEAASFARTVVPDVGHSAIGATSASERLIYGALREHGAIREGLFTVAGVTVYYSNGAHYCGFPTMDLYRRITGRRDIIGLRDYAAIPARMVDDGICGGRTPEGLFTVAGVTVYYSNGTHYCGFPTMDLYERLTGRRDISGLPDYPAVPASFIFDGVCQG